MIQYLWIYFSESYENEHQYDSANRQEYGQTRERTGNEETRLQLNTHETQLETLQNPYYGVKNTEMEAKNPVQTVKITENPYYE